MFSLLAFKNMAGVLGNSVSESAVWGGGRDVMLKWTCAWAVTLACWLHTRGVASSCLEQPCVGGVAVEVDGVLVQGLRWEVDYLQLEVAQATLFDGLGIVIEQCEGQHVAAAIDPDRFGGPLLILEVLRQLLVFWWYQRIYYLRRLSQSAKRKANERSNGKVTEGGFRVEQMCSMVAPGSSSSLCDKDTCASPSPFPSRRVTLY